MSAFFMNTVLCSQISKRKYDSFLEIRSDSLFCKYKYTKLVRIYARRFILFVYIYMHVCSSHGVILSSVFLSLVLICHYDLVTLTSFY